MKFDIACSENIIADVYDDLRARFQSSRFDLDSILAKVFSKRGKGIRPLFMCLAAQMAGGSWEDVRKAAVIIEAIHLASLLHDDVLDGAEIRRGGATLNAQYSDKVSILFGDQIFLNAIIMANELGYDGAVDVIHSSVKRMVEGEICDTLEDGMITEEDYIRIIGDKTASLFAVSGKLGVILSDGDVEKAAMAGELGELLGTAFQIVDDTLDYMGDAVTMGKPTFLDAASKNVTLPLIYSLRDMSLEDASAFLAAHENDYEELTAFVRKNGGIEYAIGRARDYTDKARGMLSKFEKSPAHDTFERLFDMLMNRQN